MQKAFRWGFFTVQIFQKEADMYMKEMIPKDDYGIFVDSKDTARVDSVFVAKFFEKRHDDVLKSIRNLDCSDEFRLRNFAET